jgi:hypothetical protein
LILSNQEIFRGSLKGSKKLDDIASLILQLKEELKDEFKNDMKNKQLDIDIDAKPKLDKVEDFSEKEKDKKCCSEFSCQCEVTTTGILPENELFLEVLGQEILITMDADQYNILGQTFRPIFCGKVVEVTNGFITLDPVIIKMSNAPFHRFPTPLSFAMERITNFTPFDCDIQFPIP